jgi:putative FmdB family regulatory protein
MPIYEYSCQSCQKRFEKIQKVADPPCKKCPSCGGKLKKLISSPAIQFKGKGFYINDYAKKDSPSGESSDGKAKGKGKPAKDAAETIPSDKPCSD